VTRLLIADELAELLRVPRTHVYRLAREDAIPCVRLGKYVRFDPKQIEAWIDSRHCNDEEAGNGKMTVTQQNGRAPRKRPRPGIRR
jgi:excisionase family DNA binding protein